MPNLITIYEKIEQIQESDNNLQQRITFDITKNGYEKTIGFALNFTSENELEVYELKETVYHQRNFRLVTRTNIANSDHMLVNVVKKKSFYIAEPSLNIYGGRLKGGNC
ncbi:MAG: hypothetical protein Q8784_01625 [Vigna little leaf phytoplasma]|nr:hypothetical protein [Vigna little leaf phytoplasma]